MIITITSAVGLVLLGIAVGFISGLLGIGGGVLVVPSLVILFGFEQRMANGTSLAMLFPPAGIPAIFHYWREQKVHVAAAVLLACGFVLGAYIGAICANRIEPNRLRQIFAFFMLFIAAMMLFRGDVSTRAVMTALLLMVVYSTVFAIVRLLGRRWDKAIAAPELYRQRVQQPFAPDYEI
jgi:uncharacterized protein